MSNRRPNIGRLVCLTAPVFLAFYLGASVGPRLIVKAGIRDPATQPQHFLAGGERAVPVLKEISETLKQIDTRLLRIEAIVAEAAEQ